jgi:hypothetical protein
VFSPFSTSDTSILGDVDLAFAFSLSSIGKIHFDYVYGIVFECMVYEI